MTKTSTPRELGYRFPAEWEPHAATWLAWPHNQDTWPGELDNAIREYAVLARTISQFEPLHVLAGGVMHVADSYLGSLPNVTLHDIPTNDAWIRDFGPTFIAHPERRLAVVDWGYNAWGNKYPPFDRDCAAATQIAQRREMTRFSPSLILEGGSVDGNGQGVLLTTRTCLLNPNRNPQLSEANLECCLNEYLAASTVIWLDGCIAGDDTDGHIDQLARFVTTNTVVVAAESDPSDENYHPLRTLGQQLRQASLPGGGRLDIVELPMPSRVFYRETRLPASYANFYVLNSAVIVPQFDDAADKSARRILADVFPDRNVVGLPSRHLVWGLGSFHCLTQQEPATDHISRG